MWRNAADMIAVIIVTSSTIWQTEDTTTSVKTEELQSCRQQKFPCFYDKFLHSYISTYTIPREADLKAIHEDLVGVRGRDDKGDTVQLWEGPAYGNNKGDTELGGELRYPETLTSFGKPRIITR